MHKPWFDHYDYWVRPHMNYPRRPLGDMLRLTASDVPDTKATSFLGAHALPPEAEGDKDRYIDLVCKDEFPLSIFYGSLKAKLAA